jgi:hypothetical protein
VGLASLSPRKKGGSLNAAYQVSSCGSCGCDSDAVAVSGTVMAQGVPFDPAGCESVEGQYFCEGALVDLVGGSQPIAVPVCYVIDDSGNVLAVYPGDCTDPTSG